VLEWLKLCVLEDKLVRLCSKSTSGDSDGVVESLLETRTWDSAKYPAWLAFEVEQQLQI
jgi:hypothetical protein